MFKEKTNESHSMNTPKMSYFSDIDLATLHRTRLNERIQYKLSWFNRRQKYYIPPTSKHTSIKTIADQKYKTDVDKSRKSTPNITSTIEKKSTLNHKNGSKHNTKSICVNKNSPLTVTTTTASATATNYSIRNLNHCDNSTKDAQNNTISNTINNQVNDVDKPLADIDVPLASSAVSLASSDPDTMKCITVKHSALHSKCLTGDAINRNARITSNQCVEEDLNVPHRNRSGTWP